MCLVITGFVVRITCGFVWLAKAIRSLQACVFMCVLICHSFFFHRWGIACVSVGCVCVWFCGCKLCCVDINRIFLLHGLVCV